MTTTVSVTVAAIVTATLILLITLEAERLWHSDIDCADGPGSAVIQP